MNTRLATTIESRTLTNGRTVVSKYMEVDHLGRGEACNMLQEGSH